MAVAELMRILLDQAGLGWDEAWDLTVRTLAYTNHTLLPEALEKWPVELFEQLLPRHLRDHLRDQPPLPRRRAQALPRRRRPRRPHEPDRGGAGAQGAHGQPRHRRLAQHQRRGRDPLRAAARSTVVPDFAEMFPERFNNKTNGVTPRRWLLHGQPAAGPADHRGDRRRLGHRPGPAAQARSRWPRTRPSATSFRTAKREAKTRFADWLKSATGQIGRSRLDLRQPDQAHPRVQAAAAQRPAHHRSLQPPARQPERSTCRRAPSSSPARRPRRTTWPSSSSSSSTTSRRRSTPTRRCAAGSRCCSCPTTTSAWRSG